MRQPPLLLLALGLAAGIALAFYSGRAIYRAWVSQHWPTAEAIVTGSEIQVSRSRRSVQYQPHIEYRYSVAGQEYSSDVLSFAAVGTGADTAREWTERYPRGSSVQVHYAPDDPAVSCVSCGRPGWRDGLAALGGTALALVSGAGVAQSLRDRARRAPRRRPRAA